ncbi:MAG TPA: DUF1499 domain-containing protein [Myxococcaceae bacterium]|jgi:uncharacterized protein (DUF1499 family)
MLRHWPVRISLVAVLLLVLGPLLAFLGVLPGFVGFIAFALGALVGFIGVVAGIIGALRGQSRPGMVAVALGLLTIVAVLFPAMTAGKHPRINDISTDLEDVPAFSQAAALPGNEGRNLSYPAEFKPIVRESYKDLKPLRVSGAPDAVFERAVALAKEQPRWQVTAVDPQARTFEGVVETGIFRFRDDFVVRVRPDGEATRVDMRSKSRVGKGDLGANAKRIEQFLQGLATRAGAGTEKPEAGR